MSERDSTDDDSIELSRRDYFRTLGVAGAAGLAGLNTSGSALADSGPLTHNHLGSASYTTYVPDVSGISDLPQEYDSSTYHQPPGDSRVYTTSNVSPPYPRNRWWSSLLFASYDDPYSANLVSQPLISKANDRGLWSLYPKDWGGDPAETLFPQADHLGTGGILLGHSENHSFPDTRVEDWGDWHVTAKWGEGSDSWLQTTMAKGSPFVFAEYGFASAGGQAEINLGIKDAYNGGNGYMAASDSNVTVWEDRGNVLGITLSGITAANYQMHFAVFAPEGATINNVGSAQMTIDLAGSNYLTVAHLPAQSTTVLNKLEKYAYNFIEDTTYTTEYVERDSSGNLVSEVRSAFNVQTDNKPESPSASNTTFSCLLPHQYKNLDGDSTLSSTFDYWSSHGTLKGWEGSSFRTVKKYRGILPRLPQPTGGSYSESTHNSHFDDLLNNYPFRMIPEIDHWYNSTYWMGKDLHRNIDALGIAENLGRDTDAQAVADFLKNRLESWAQVNDTSYGTHEEEEVFVYQPTIGSVFGFPDGNFGVVNALTDHHFHYGYFLHAAAEIARRDSTWADSANFGDFFEMLLRDYANWERPDRSASNALDPSASLKNAFPRFGHFSPYAGHSWTSGVVYAGAGPNQESSSEAINAYAAMIKWGAYTGNDVIRRMGICLYTHEVEAIWEYWFDNDDDVHPDTYGQNTTKGGGEPLEYSSIHWGTGYDHHVFWNYQDEAELYGINWLPQGGHSLYLNRDPTYAESNYQRLLTSRENMGNVPSGEPSDYFDTWPGICAKYRSFSDPADAVSVYQNGPDISPSGVSEAHVYNYIHWMNSVGRPDRTVYADTTFFAVFDDGAEKTYVAYNEDSTARDVTFSDGTVIQSVQPGDLAVHSASNPYDPGSGSGDTTDPTAPSNLTSPAKSETSVDLDWDAASDTGGSGLDHYEVFVDGSSTKTVPAGTTTTTVSGLSSGTTYSFSVRAVDGAGNTSAAAGPIDVTTSPSTTQSAYNGPHAVPGTVEAENFDQGGSGVAYSDTTSGNTGGAYRSTDVDLESSTRDGADVGWIVSGEWLEYTVQVDSDGDYDVTALVASNSGGGSFDLSVDGTQVTSTSFAATGGWQTWTEVSVGTVSLTAGEHVVRVDATASDWNFNWLSFAASGDQTAPSAPTTLSSGGHGETTVDLSWTASSDGGTGVDHYNVYVDGSKYTESTSTTVTVSGLASGTTYDFAVSAVDGAGNESGMSSTISVTTDPASTQSPYGGSATQLPGTLEAEEYDEGGSGVAYSDTTSGNTGGAFRTDDVDIETCTEGGYNVGWITDGEWLEYTVDVTEAGDYDLNFRVASSGGGGPLVLKVDGSDVTGGGVSVPDTGGWQTWQTVTVSGVSLSSGTQTIRVEASGGGFNLNYVEFVQTSSGSGGSGTSYSGSTGNGWSATVSQVDTETYEWTFEPSNTASWADIQFADPGTDAWVGYPLDDSDGDNVHVYTRDASGDGSEIDVRFVWDDGSGGQYISDRRTHTY